MWRVPHLLTLNCCMFLLQLTQMKSFNYSILERSIKHLLLMILAADAVTDQIIDGRLLTEDTRIVSMETVGSLQQ